MPDKIKSIINFLGISMRFRVQRYQDRLFLLVLIVFLGFAAAAPVTAFTVTMIAVDPPGALVSGTSLISTFNVDFLPSGGETFPSGNLLQMSTDLDNVRWNYTLILDRVDSPQPGSSGQTLSISGWVLYYPATVNESLRVTLEGTAPYISSSTSRTIVNVTEFDSHNNPVDPQFSRSALVNPAGAGTPATITFNGNLTITPGTTAYIPIGGTVTWVNDDPLHPHGVQAVSIQTAKYFGGLDTKIIPYGTPFEVTFDQEGLYDYKTVFQPEMAGQIIVYAEIPPVAPVANFTGAPRTGAAPLTVSFTDESTGYPTGRAWFFGDEDYTEPWTLVNGSAGWEARIGHSSVALPDGSIVLMGGVGGTESDYIIHNDTWRSTDKGATWALMNASSGWEARGGHTTVTLPDGSIGLMGGSVANMGLVNDTWRSTDKGSTWTLMNASPGWTARISHTSVAMPDGSIVLMGGYVPYSGLNDTWRSTDNGATWTQINASSGWINRYMHQSVVTPDGSIVLMGGWSHKYYNDTWQSADNGATWAEVNASSGWSERIWHTSVAMPDGSIVLMGGELESGTILNDVWRSTDNGTTWTMINASAGWYPRIWHRSVVLPDGSIVLMGGENLNDVWSLQPAGSTEQDPLHIYTRPGRYDVSLQVYHADGYNSTRKAGYITVLGPAPTITGIMPATGVNTTSVSITKLAGTNFNTTIAPTVKLNRTGYADIIATDVTVVNSTTITCTFPVTHQPAGFWNVVVTNPDGQDGMLANGFTITEPGTTTIPTTEPTIISESSSSSDNETATALPSVTNTVNVGGSTAVNRVIITGTGITGLIVTGTVKPRPDDGPYPPGIVYQYIDLVPARFSSITGAEIFFSVPQSWLDQHQLAPKNVVLYHLTGDGWVALLMKILETKDGHIYYSTTSPGFSLFAIAGTLGNLTAASISVDTDIPAKTALTTVPVKINAEISPVVPETSTAQPTSGLPVTPIVILSGAGLGMIAIIFLVRRWWIRRQNPALFREND
jgi:PKD repeat protein